MSESKEYWKHILGDAYDDELISSILNDTAPSRPEKQEKAPSVQEFTFVEPEKSEPEPDKIFFKIIPGEVFEKVPVTDAPETQAFRDAITLEPVDEPSEPVDTPFEPEEDPQTDPAFAEFFSPRRRMEPETLDTGKPEVDVDFDYDNEYVDENDDRPIKIRREKRSGCLGGILYALFIACVAFVGAALLWMATTDVFGFGKKQVPVEITIPDDCSINDVTNILYDNGIVKYKKLFNLYAKFSHAEEKIASGTYQVLASYDYFALVNGLTPDSGVLVETDFITIPEGYTLFKIFELLEQNEVCSAEELWKCAATYNFDYDFLDPSTLGQRTRLEGYMFPDTYKFYVNDKPERVIEKFLDNFDKKFDDEFRARAEELDYSINEILTIASMIEKEAADDEERDLIASVIYNRLNASDEFPWLQIDATIYYTIEQTGEEFSLEVDSPYNTYKIMGLPPAPIANPGMMSIRAALYPQDTSYYYYALHVDGYHEFFSSQSGFEEFVYSDEYGG